MGANEKMKISKFKFFLNTLRDKGLYRTTKILISSYFKVNKFIVFYKNLEKPFNYPTKDSSNYDSSIEFVKISLKDLNMLRKKEKQKPVQFYCDISFKSTTPFVALINGKIAAITWGVDPGEYSNFLELEQGDVELHYTLVLSEFEGKGLSMLLKSFAIKNYIKENRKRMFAVTNVNNIANYKLMIRLGFEPVEVLTHFAFNKPKATLKYVK